MIRPGREKIMVMTVDKITKQERMVFHGSPDEEVRFCERWGWMYSDEYGSYWLGINTEEDCDGCD